jgi:solute carrier family 25, member 34/35
MYNVPGLQGGLAPALLYQLSMNGTRLGLYEPMKRLIGADKDKNSVAKKVLAGGSCGVLSAIVGSPFFMIKVFYINHVLFLYVFALFIKL